MRPSAGTPRFARSWSWPPYAGCGAGAPVGVSPGTTAGAAGRAASRCRRDRAAPATVEHVARRARLAVERRPEPVTGVGRRRRGHPVLGEEAVTDLEAGGARRSSGWGPGRRARLRDSHVARRRRRRGRGRGPAASPARRPHERSRGARRGTSDRTPDVTPRSSRRASAAATMLVGLGFERLDAGEDAGPARVVVGHAVGEVLVERRRDRLHAPTAASTDVFSFRRRVAVSGLEQRRSGRGPRARVLAGDDHSGCRARWPTRSAVVLSEKHECSSSCDRSE